MTASSQLAEFALKAFSQKIPMDVYDVAVLAIIDQYGLQIGGSEFSWSKAIHQYSKKYAGKGGSTVTRYGDALPAVQAAFINGSFAHAQDFDDSHQEAQTHPGSEGSPENLFTLSDVKEKYFKIKFGLNNNFNTINHDHIIGEKIL